MTITLKPSDMITRFIWDKYQHFCLDDKTSTEIAQIIEDDELFTISEKDAFVIGLTNVLYTPEVVYKLKQFLLEILSNKSFDYDEDVDTDNKIRSRSYINKQILIYSISSFKNKIPKNWSYNDIEFNMGLEQLPTIYDDFIEAVENLDVLSIQDWPCVKCAQVKKIINKLK